ncbi:MAG: PLDc_N domain-containing protein [Coriobacteriia bacterium]|nr:PLDc_N domain-containing protein [Coriobacteriia bacterium]
MQSNVPLSEMPGWVLALVGVLVVLQLSLQVYAFVRLLKTPEERLVLGKKWPWILIILFGEILGAIVFLAAGRKPASANDPLASADGPAPGERAARAADVLYGEQPGSAIPVDGER